MVTIGLRSMLIRHVAAGRAGTGGCDACRLAQLIGRRCRYLRIAVHRRDRTDRRRRGVGIPGAGDPHPAWCRRLPTGNRRHDLRRRQRCGQSGVGSDADAHGRGDGVALRGKSGPGVLAVGRLPVADRRVRIRAARAAEEIGDCPRNGPWVPEPGKRGLRRAVTRLELRASASKSQFDMIVWPAPMP
jgi:hypothetical protein